MTHDVFISHACEDKDDVALPLSRLLAERGIEVWLDRYELTLGDSLRQTITRGLADSRYGVVVLSPAFLAKDWPQRELNALSAKEEGEDKVILPVWHGVTHADLTRVDPLLADKLAVSTDPALPDLGLEEVARQIEQVVRSGRPPEDTLPGSSEPPLAPFRTRLLMADTAADLKRLSYDIESYIENKPHDTDARMLQDTVSTALQRELERELQSGKSVAVPAPPAKTGSTFNRWSSAAMAVAVLGFAIVIGKEVYLPRTAQPPGMKTNSTEPTDPLDGGAVQFIEPDMVVIEPGTFVMGNPAETIDASQKNTPGHEVTFARAFAVGVTEVTFDEYQHFVSATAARMPNDQGWGRGDRPVIDVSWDDAVAYAQWLTKVSGRGYRLPSEAEWERAARAGTQTVFAWGDGVGNNLANCAACGSAWDSVQTAPVRSFEANPLGLYDTVGNVLEWVQDCWHENYLNAPDDGLPWLEADDGQCGLRVLRGGSWYHAPESSRLDARFWKNRGNRSGFIGFRLARTL